MKTVKDNESGVALLSVLLLVAVMSLAALAMLELTTTAIRVAKSADQRSRTSWQIAGTEQAGLIGVSRLHSATNGELRRGVPGLEEEFLMEVNGAQISARIEDDTNCFNLNSLLAVEEGTAEQTADANYRVLLEAIGFIESDVDNLTDALIDWMDADNSARLSGAEDAYYATLRPSYRTSGTLLAELSELRAIRGYSKEVMEVLRPLVCARLNTDHSVLNVNTLEAGQSGLLAMSFSGELSLDEARDIITGRPLGGWATLEAMLEDETIARIGIDLRQTDLLSIRSTHLALKGEVLSNTQGTEFSVVYLLTDAMPVSIISRSFGAM